VKQIARPLKLVAVLAAAVALSGVYAVPSASAATPTKRTVSDPVEPGKAYDIVQVQLRSSPGGNKPAVVVVRHGRNETVGDSIDVWFNLDEDKTPDVHIVGDAGSEYRVFRTDSFTEDGKEISNKGCFSMSIRLDKTKVKFDPNCVGKSEKFGVSVRSSRFDKPDSANDWVRAPEKFTKKVLAFAS
jgi:hypothetical protein